MTTMQTENIKLKLERLIKAPRERVFKAWTDPEQIKQWFVPCGKAGEVTTPSAKCDCFEHNREKALVTWPALSLLYDTRPPEPSCASGKRLGLPCFVIKVLKGSL